MASLGQQSIAVLPFANRSNVSDDLYFTDGIHDDLLTQLKKIKALKVISRTSVMKFRASIKTISQIAQKLGVATLLEGGVQRAGKRIRINAQLIVVADVFVGLQVTNWKGSRSDDKIDLTYLHLLRHAIDIVS